MRERDAGPAAMIREARRARGWTLDRLSAALARPVSRQYLSDLERGYREPGEALMDDLAAALDLPADHLAYALGRWPADLRDGLTPEQVEAGMAALRAAVGRPRKATAPGEGEGADGAAD